jgi:hypothetical protein
LREPSQRDPLSIIEIFARKQHPPPLKTSQSRDLRAANSQSLSNRQAKSSGTSQDRKQRKISFKKGDVETDDEIVDEIPDVEASGADQSISEEIEQSKNVFSSSESNRFGKIPSAR